MDATLAFLDATGGTIARIALTAFVVVNGCFIAAVVLRRDRGLVDRWTKRLVVLDAALLLAAGGAPLASWAARTTVRAVALVMPDPPTIRAAEAESGPGVAGAAELPAGRPQ